MTYLAAFSDTLSSLCMLRLVNLDQSGESVLCFLRRIYENEENKATITKEEKQRAQRCRFKKRSNLLTANTPSFSLLCFLCRCTFGAPLFLHESFPASDSFSRGQSAFPVHGLLCGRGNAGALVSGWQDGGV